MRTFVIAEAGVNHNGSLTTAKALIDAAVNAGADAVKFQTFKAERVVTATAAKATYQLKNTGEGSSQFEMLKNLELSLSSHEELFYYCKDRNILFMSTPFDEQSAAMLDNLGMSIFKIPSGEITNKPLVRVIAAKGKPVILSTGMSTLGEVEKALSWINGEWKILDKSPSLTLLHCVSNYPAAVEDINLLAINTMASVFGLPVGYSDHTLGTEIAIAAVALGARTIEKHLTLDRTMKGSDHKASLEPEELKTMIKAIRNIEKAMGDGIKRPVKNEEENRNIARRSLVTAMEIKAGSTIHADAVVIKRPGDGIPPEFKELIIGMQATRDIEADEVIRWDNLRHA